MDHQEVADRLAIRELVERYSSAVTCRDWDAMAACFHPESRWRASPFGLDFKTRDGIRESLIATITASDFLVQMTHSIVIDDLTADRARTTVVINEVARREAAKIGIFILGVYHDVVTKIGGRWAFEERHFHGHYRDDAWLGGDLLVDYATRP